MNLLNSLAFLVVAGLAMAENEQLVQLARANEDFGLQLLHRLEVAEKTDREATNAEPKNLFISPFSVSSVLAMLMAGGGNETYEEIRNTLRFASNLTETEIYASYKALLQQYQSLAPSTSPTNELQVANSIAMQNKFQLLQTYTDSVSGNFDSKIFTVDFATKAAEATEQINSWVSNKTNGKIPQLFEQTLSPSTMMVLLNAIYFKGAWKTQFDKNLTDTDEFRYATNKSVVVPMMWMGRRRFNFADFEDGELLELPYESDSLSMLLFLPNQEKAKEHQSISSQFAKVLSQASTNVASRLAQLRNTTINIALPRFKIESSFSLKSTLQTMGIQSAFSSAKANFSRIAGQSNLVLADVLHKTLLEVNEEGSVAAGVTAGVILKKSGIQPREITFDRPFLLAIRDNINQLTLFTGVVNKP